MNDMILFRSNLSQLPKTELPDGYNCQPYRAGEMVLFEMDSLTSENTLLVRNFVDCIVAQVTVMPQKNSLYSSEVAVYTKSYIPGIELPAVWSLLNHEESKGTCAARVLVEADIPVSTVQAYKEAGFHEYITSQREEDLWRRVYMEMGLDTERTLDGVEKYIEETLFAEFGVKLWNDVKYPEGTCQNHIPQLLYFPVEGADRAVVVCRGGAYQVQSYHEGIPICEFYRSQGIAAFLLCYSVEPVKMPQQLWDVNRGVRLARYIMAENGVPDAKIAVLGFSAGGHLASMAVTMFDREVKLGNDAVDQFSPRPDAGIFGYPVISLEPPYGYTHSARVLFEEKDREKLAAEYSTQKHVTKDTPPCFFWHNCDDRGVNALNSIMFCAALNELNIPYSLHVFPKGGHGNGLAWKVPMTREWTKLSAEWFWHI